MKYGNGIFKMKNCYVDCRALVCLQCLLFISLRCFPVHLHIASQSIIVIKTEDGKGWLHVCVGGASKTKIEMQMRRKMKVTEITERTWRTKAPFTAIWGNI